MLLTDFYKGKKIFLTGQTGFCGSWMSQLLLCLGAKVSGYALKPLTNPALFEILGLAFKIKHYQKDIRDFSKLKNVLQKESPEIIFHLAAQPLVLEGYKKPLETFATNIIGAANVLEAAKTVSSVKAVVVITTDKVYKDCALKPLQENDCLGGSCPYSASKAAAEIICACYQKTTPDFLTATARAGNILGGGDWSFHRLIPDIVRAVFEKKETPILRNPKAVRPWQFILEPLWGYLMLGEKLWQGEKRFASAWNFGPDPQIVLTVGEIAEKFLALAKAGDYLVSENNFTKEEQTLILSNQKAKDILGWQPIFNIEETLQLALSWYLAFYQKKDVKALTLAQIKMFLEKII